MINPTSLENAREVIHEFLQKTKLRKRPVQSGSVKFRKTPEAPEEPEGEEDEEGVPPGIRIAELYQCGGGMYNREPIQTFEFDPSEDLHAVTNDIVEYAEQEASELEVGESRKVQFIVKLERGEGQKVFSLVFNDKDNEDRVFGDSAMNPSANGMVAQAMQHSHAAVKMALENAHDSLRQKEREIRQLNERIQYLERDWMNRHELMESLFTRAHERQLEILHAEYNEKRKDEMIQRVLPMAGVALNHLMRGGGGPGQALPTPPGQPTPVDMMLRELTNSISPEQLQSLISTDLFNDSQKAVIFNLFQTAKAQEEAEVGQGQTQDPGPKTQGGVET